MLISVKHNFIFLSTPKCASKSIDALLRPFSDIAFLGPASFRHTNYRRYRKFIHPYLKESTGNDDLETICLVREPLSWLNSYYRFNSRSQIRNPNHRNFNNCTYGISFSEFVEAYMSPTPPTYANVGSQFNFVMDEASGVGVDRIFPYEDIDAFLQYMSHKIGKRLKIRYSNVSPTTANKSNLVAMMDRAGRKIMTTMNLRPTVRTTREEFQISCDLLGRLRHFIHQDFELYEKVRANFPMSKSMQTSHGV